MYKLKYKHYCVSVKTQTAIELLLINGATSGSILLGRLKSRNSTAARLLNFLTKVALQI